MLPGPPFRMPLARRRRKLRGRTLHRGHLRCTAPRAVLAPPMRTRALRIGFRPPRGRRRALCWPAGPPHVAPPPRWTFQSAGARQGHPCCKEAKLKGLICKSPLCRIVNQTLRNKLKSRGPYRFCAASTVGGQSGPACSPEPPPPLGRAGLFGPRWRRRPLFYLRRF